MALEGYFLRVTLENGVNVVQDIFLNRENLEKLMMEARRYRCELGLAPSLFHEPT